MGWVVFLSVCLVIIMIPVMLYNNLIRLRNQGRNALQQVTVQLQRRHELIPTLVETTRAYLQHERETLEAVTRARQQAVDFQKSLAHQSLADSPQLLQGLEKVEHALTASLAQFRLVAENYPELKADSVMQQLMDELVNTENRVGFARQAYNDQVMHYHNGRETFPGNVIANTFNFLPLQTLAVDRVAVQQPVQVQFPR